MRRPGTRPSWRTAFPRRSASTTSTVSRSAVYGRAGSRPIGARTREPPTPNPVMTRPGASSASVANAAAVATGWRLNGFVMPAETAIRSVPSRIAVIAT